MVEFFFKLYRFIFARKVFYKFNKFVYLCGLRGLGVLNYESAVVNGEDWFLRKFIAKRKKIVVFDVGANIGNYTKNILKNNSDVCIYAFEPHPRNFKILISNVHHVSFYPYNVAVGSGTGTLNLYDYADADGSSHASLYRDVIECIHDSNSVSCNVSVVSLDEFAVNNNLSKIDLLKIDVEGHELEVLNGATRLVAENKIDIIHFEFNEMNVLSRTFFKDFWDKLNHYDLYRLLPNSLVKIERYNPIFCELFAYQNIIAILKNYE